MTIALRDCVSVQRHLEIGTEEDVNIKDVLANLIWSKTEPIECKENWPPSVSGLSDWPPLTVNCTVCNIDSKLALKMC